MDKLENFTDFEIWREFVKRFGTYEPVDIDSPEFFLPDGMSLTAGFNLDESKEYNAKVCYDKETLIEKLAKGCAYDSNDFVALRLVSDVINTYMLHR